MYQRFMIGLRKKYRIVVPVTIILGLFIAVVVKLSNDGRKRGWQILSIPAQQLSFVKEPDGYYSIIGVDLPTIVITEYDLELLNDSGDSWTDTPDRRIVYDSNYIVDIYPKYEDMAKQMAQFTDNLATHDCLFKLSLSPVTIWRRVPQEEIQSFGRSRLLRFWVEIVIENCRTISSYLWRSTVNNPLMINNNEKLPYYEYVYKSFESGYCYLLAELPAEEKDWNLYYYPSVLLDESIIDSGALCIKASDSFGSLYSLAKNGLTYYNEVYSYLPGTQCYTRCVYKEPSSLQQSSTQIYMKDTERLNTLIKDYYFKNEELCDGR